MANSGALQKSLGLAIALGLAFSLLIIFSMGGARASDLGRALGYTLTPWLFSGVVTGLWARASKRSWGWPRYGVTVVGFWVMFSVLAALGRR